MPTLEELQAQLAALQQAYVSGVLTVKHKDVETTFRSMQALREAMAFVQSQIRILTGAPRKPKYIREHENDLKKPDGGY
jgi:hypothetical protein